MTGFLHYSDTSLLDESSCANEPAITVGFQ
jgi:hypothetical protein